MSTPDLNLVDISAALVRAVASLPGLAGRVHRGRYGINPPSTPYAAVSAPGVQSVQGSTMGQYTRTLVYDLVVWAQASRSELDTRVDESEALLNAVVTALEVERADPASTLYRLSTWRVRSGVLDALADPVPANGTNAFVTVECSYRRARGLSGVAP